MRRAKRPAAALGIALLLALGGAPPGAADAPAPAGPPVALTRAVMSVDAVQWPNYVAQALGFYAKENLTVDDQIMDARTTVTALIGGSVDIAYGDSTSYVLAVAKGAQLIDVGYGMDRIPYRFMAAPSVKHIGDLKGKIVSAAAPGEVFTTVIREILEKGGLNPDKDVTFIYGGSSGQRLGALEGGAVQAALIPMPANLMLTSQGFNSLAFTPDLYPSLQVSLTLVRTDWAQQHADVLKRFLRAQTRAITWLYDPANKAEALRILSAATKATPDIAAATYDYYVGHHAFAKDGCPTTGGIETLLKLMAQSGQTTLQPSAAAGLTTTQYCR